MIQKGWGILLLGVWISLLSNADGATHYGKAPGCILGESAAEVQGEAGNLCAPACEAETYNCPMDMPEGASAQPQCMLKDIGGAPYCGLLCNTDTQCPSGGSCRRIRQVDVGICLYPVSFTDWAQASNVKKLAVGWPSGGNGNSMSLKIAKAYAALQSIKKRYSVEDGDPDMLTVKEFMSSLSARPGAMSVAAGPPPGPPGGASSSSFSSPSVAIAAPKPVAPKSEGSMLGAWGHDLNYFEKNLMNGEVGLEKEVNDTIWNLEHLQNRGICSMFLRSVVWIILAYLGIGSALKYYTEGARGVEMIPHLHFWAEYPNLVMDGVAYTKMLVSGDGDSVSASSRSGGRFSSGAATRGKAGAGSYQQMPSPADRDTFSNYEPL